MNQILHFSNDNIENMINPDPFENYYKVLQCEKTASFEELKKNYQRLLLSSHPDKVGERNGSFCLIQKAWSVLKDPQSRKLYDAELSCQEHSDVLLFDTIFLRDMDNNDVENVYSYQCRCGGTYILEVKDSMPSKVNIGCDECSFSIQVNL